MFSKKLDKAVRKNAQNGSVFLPVVEIVVNEQIRKEFEDGENTIDDLIESIRTYDLMQALTVRVVNSKYELVSGERRLRACKALGYKEVEVKILDLNDEQAEAAQAQENIQRKQLTLIEEAGLLQKKLDKLGSVEAVLDDIKKNKAWFSKRMALLRLPDNARRLVDKGGVKDIEAVNAVAQIEKTDVKAAKELVDKILKPAAAAKVTSVRKQVSEVKKIVDAKKAGVDKSSLPVDDKGVTQDEVIDVLRKFYIDIYEHQKTAMTLLSGLDKTTKEGVYLRLKGQFDRGVKSKKPMREALVGFRDGRFSDEGYAVFDWIAFQNGALSAVSGVDFNLLDVLNCVKS